MDIEKERELFHAWARDNIGQCSFAGKHIRNGEWFYEHNWVRKAWECWLYRAGLAFAT